MQRTLHFAIMALLLLGTASLNAQDGYYFHDDFEDNNIQDGDPAIWKKGGWSGGGTVRVEDGDVYIDDCGSGECGLGLWAGSGSWARYTDVSYRLQGRILEGSGSIAFWGRSLDARVYYGYVNTSGEQGIGDTLSGGRTRVRLPFDVDMAVDDVVMKIDFIGDEISMSTWRAGDAPIDLPLASFRDNTLRTGTVGPTVTSFGGPVSVVFRWMEVAEIVPGDVDTNDVMDVRDIDYLSAAIRDGLDSNRYDVNRNGMVSIDDRQMLIGSVMNLWVGDANLDGEFNSSDFVEVFIAGEYEDDPVGNSTWATGDWNGDGEFSSSDFVAAFNDGGYEQGLKEAPAAVPEPGSSLLLLLGFLGLSHRRGRNPVLRKVR